MAKDSRSMQKQIKTILDDFIAKLPVAATWSGTDKVDWLLVSCIDYRYAHYIHEYMVNNYPGKFYDQLVLAGASLAGADGYTGRDYWRKTFIEHVGLAIDLHGITGVLILDHRTCGAYREFKLLTVAEQETAVELEKHRDVAKEATTLASLEFVRRKHPGLIEAHLLPKIAAGTGGPTPVADLLCTVTV